MLQIGADAPGQTDTPRARAKRSCDSCYRRKIRCEVEVAGRACENCHFHDLECTFHRPIVSRTRVQKTRVGTLKDRLEKLEIVLKRLGLPSPDRIGNVEPANEGARKKLKGVRITSKRVLSADFSIPFLSRQGQRWIQFAGAGAASPTSSHASRAGSLDLTSNSTLPDRTAILACLEMYKVSPFSDVFPIIREASFMETISRAYGDATCTAAQGCFLAFYTISSMFEWNQPLEPPEVHLHDLAVGKLLMPHVLSGRPSLELAQTLVMMTILTFSSGTFESVDTHLSLAVRTLFALGAHLQPSPDSVEEQHFRDLFWITYGFDSEFALRSGRPPVINDASCDLTLPDDYTTSGTRSKFQSDLSLNLIKSEAYTKLYNFASLKKPDAELLKDIRLLDQALENWRSSIPVQVRPALTYREDNPQAGVTDIKWILLRLEYHHCVCTIHQAVTRVTRASGYDEAVSSSLDIASDASRSILLYFRDQQKYLPPAFFWVYSAYPITAMLMLFCEIISNTGITESAQIGSDLDLLEDAVSNLRDMGSAANPLSHHIQSLTSFLEELVEIAKAVVDPVAVEEQQRLKRELSM